MAALCGLNILDALPEERFDRITRTAQRAFDCPIALVTLVDSERQWFKSRIGLDAPQTPRNISFCGHAILCEFPFIIPDAAADPRFADNPLVLGAPHIRFYAGIPLRADTGALVGTLCLIDRVPRSFSDDDLATLCDLAQWAELELNVYTITQATRISREKEARLQAIVENAGDAIITIDDHGLVETFNPEAQRLFAYRPHQIIGKPLSMLIARHYRAAAMPMK